MICDGSCMKGSPSTCMERMCHTGCQGNSSAGALNRPGALTTLFQQLKKGAERDMVTQEDLETQGKAGSGALSGYGGEEGGGGSGALKWLWR